MFKIKELFWKEEKNFEDKMVIEKFIEIEQNNLEIEVGKFHHSIGKANSKMKKTIFLRYIYYYLSHLHLTKKEVNKLKLSGNVEMYLNLLIMDMRVQQILKLVQKNYSILEESKIQNYKIVDCHSKMIQIECNCLIEKIVKGLDLIKEHLPKKYRYNKLEKIELEKVIQKIEEEKMKMR